MEHNFPEKASAYQWQAQKSKLNKDTGNDDVAGDDAEKDVQWPLDADALRKDGSEPFDENARYD